LSVTVTVIVLVEGDYAMAGRQVKNPLAELSAELVGAVTKLKVSVCGGASVTLALVVTFNDWPAMMVWSAIAASVGAVLSGMSMARAATCAPVSALP